jgi:hypothetical protein
LARRGLVPGLAALGYLLLALLYLRPIASQASSHIAPDAGDPVFNLVVLSWGSHQIETGLPDYWNLAFLYPARGVTLYSDALPGPAVLTAGVEALGGNPLLAYNLLLLGSFVLCGWGTFEVLRRNDVSAPAAFLGGMMFAFSSFRWDQMSHLPILLAGFVPLVLWSFDRLLEAPSWRRAAAFLGLYALHVTGGSYLAYMIHVPLAALLVNRLGDLWPAPGRRARWAILLATAAGAVAVLAAVFGPYVEASAGLHRYASEIQQYGASLASYFAPSRWNLYQGKWMDLWQRPENALFAGFLPTALALYALASGLRRHARAPQRPLSFAKKLVIAALALGAAAGWIAGEVRVWTGSNGLTLVGIGLPSSYKNVAWLLWGGAGAAALYRLWGGRWPLDLKHLPRFRRGLLAGGSAAFLLSFPFVYEPLMHVLPGLSGMRVPARFYVFVSFVLAFFAAAALDRLAGALRGRRAVGLWATAALILAIELAPRPFPWFYIEPREEQPPVYAWLARHKDVRALLELPMGDLFAELAYMHSATFHWRPLVNGYSGYLPRHYVELVHEGVNPIPSPAITARLRGWGVTHVLVHRRQLDEPWQRGAVDAWQQQVGAEVVYRDRHGDCVYRIGFSLTPPPAPPAGPPVTPAAR